MATVQIELEGIDNVSGVINRASGALGGLGNIASGALSVAIGNVLTPALEGAIGAFGDMFSSALENEQIQTRLAQVIKSTGGAAGVTLDEANALAQQFTHLAGGSDDAILAIEEMALRMGTVSEEQMPQFIQTTLDLAAVTGTDAVNASRLLAQSLEDPVSALGRFRRMGILFTEDQEKQIKTLQESGDTAGAMALIMDRLAEATGGAAAANAETLSGKWETFKGRLSEAGETIGTAVLPIVTQLFDQVIAPAIPIVEDLISSVAGMIAQFVGTQEPLAAVKAKFDEIMPSIQTVIDAAMNVMAAFQESMPEIQATVQQMVDFVIGQVNVLSPTLIANISSTLNSLTAFWRAHGDEIMAIVTVAFQFITVTVGGALTLLSGIIGAAMAFINGDWTGAWQIIEDTVETFMNSVLSIVGTDLETFIATWTGVFDLAKLIISTTFENIVGTVQGAIGSIVGAIQGALGWISDLVDRIGNLGNLSLPDWLTPGSPTPFELGLRGIGDALETLSVRQIPQFATAMSTISNAQTFNIDARGASMNAAMIEAVVRRVLSESGRAADVRRRTG